MNMGETGINLRETHCIGPDTREWIVGRHRCEALALRSLQLVGWSDAADGFMFVRRQPRVSQILACHSGEGEVYLDGRWCRCAAGQAYLTPAGASHAYRAVAWARWGVSWLIAEPGLVQAEHCRLVELDAEPLQSALQGLYMECSVNADAAAMHLWTELVYRYAWRCGRESVPDRRLAGLWHRVQQELARPWSIAAMAKIANVSGEHLRRLCRQSHGRSPMQQLTQMRMHRAAAMLERGEASIETVARAVGYENAFAFSTAFKRFAGKPPSAWRRSNRVQ